MLRVYAMARPRRPALERVAVIEAAGDRGSASCRATRLAETVAAEAMRRIDADPAEAMIAALRLLDPSAVDILAADAEIDTASLIVAERVKRLEARGGQRLPEREWRHEDRATVEAVASVLARRYRKYLQAG
ncbi:hypothetical protein [Altericroceibacterium xinjiangense]|uniref:hypothetical protein n=1 Tax=Altericroceibacterium xinjiangense TaxID=762261 RepID=UPI000F7E3500|nr:hypothetical protein [Altericroceibacterium xinjiangense]